jgi:hypothetical protein
VSTFTDEMCPWISKLPKTIGKPSAASGDGASVMCRCKCGASDWPEFPNSPAPVLCALGRRANTERPWLKVRIECVTADFLDPESHSCRHSLRVIGTALSGDVGSFSGMPSCTSATRPSATASTSRPYGAPVCVLRGSTVEYLPVLGKCVSNQPRTAAQYARALDGQQRPAMRGLVGQAVKCQPARTSERGPRVIRASGNTSTGPPSAMLWSGALGGVTGAKVRRCRSRCGAGAAAGVTTSRKATARSPGPSVRLSAKVAIPGRERTPLSESPRMSRVPSLRGRTIRRPVRGEVSASEVGDVELVDEMPLSFRANWPRSERHDKFYGDGGGMLTLSGQVRW